VQEIKCQNLAISHSGDVSLARQIVKDTSLTIGFDIEASEEIALVAGELASNLVKHAKQGTLILSPIFDSTRAGVQIESIDNGPGIADVEQAMTDGFSTTGSLGYGLGTVNRLMDEFEITSQRGAMKGTHIICKRWLRGDMNLVAPCPLEFGAATRPHPAMNVNGDTFTIKQWDESALVAVIDGLGHGQFAHKASQTARNYIERHFDQPLSEIFRGSARASRATRGVVMALARFDWKKSLLTFANVGNIEVRVIGSPEPPKFIIRRGIVGGNAPNPVITENRWEPRYIMVLHSDGLTTHWRWEDFPRLENNSATFIAQYLLRTLAKDNDDATVIVVKGAKL